MLKETQTRRELLQTVLAGAVGIAGSAGLHAAATPPLSAQSGKIKVESGVYDLASGKVTLT